MNSKIKQFSKFAHLILTTRDYCYDLPEGGKDGQRSHICFVDITGSRTESRIQLPKTSKETILFSAFGDELLKASLPGDLQ
jgi:hypothetical protein